MSTVGDDVTVTDDLVTWLRAQLDDDEQDAQAHLDSFRRTHGDDALAFEITEGPRWSSPVQARRVLTRVAVDRRILDAGMPRQGEHVGEYIYFGDWSSCTDDCPGTVWWETVKLLALPYADRPGYRDEWRP